MIEALLGGGTALAIAAIIVLSFMLRSALSDVRKLTDAALGAGKAQIAAELNLVLAERQRNDFKAGMVKAEDERDTARAQLEMTRIRLNHITEREANRVADSIRAADDPVDEFNRVLSEIDLPDPDGPSTSADAPANDRGDAGSDTVPPTADDEAAGDGRRPEDG